MRARAEFKGQMWTSTQLAADKFNLNYVERRTGEGAPRDYIYTGGGNSGYQAVQLAIMWGASEIILVGFTMKYLNGQKHWHADHKTTNPEEAMLRKWADAFNMLPRYVSRHKVKVFGESAITAFDKVESL
jgi:uncharacterized Rossmann fold enzyme